MRVKRVRNARGEIPPAVDVRRRGTSKYVWSGSQPKSPSIACIAAFTVGWWMNAGLSSASRAAYASTGSER